MNAKFMSYIQTDSNMKHKNWFLGKVRIIIMRYHIKKTVNELKAKSRKSITKKYPHSAIPHLSIKYKYVLTTERAIIKPIIVTRTMHMFQLHLNCPKLLRSTYLSFYPILLTTFGFHCLCFCPFFESMQKRVVQFVST